MLLLLLLLLLFEFLPPLLLARRGLETGEGIEAVTCAAARGGRRARGC